MFGKLWIILGNCVKPLHFSPLFPHNTHSFSGGKSRESTMLFMFLLDKKRGFSHLSTVSITTTNIIK